MKTKTISQTGFLITGVADLTLWGGDNGCIEMTPFEVDAPTEENILANLNDGGFGTQSINGAICDIWEYYETGYKERVRTLGVGTISHETQNYYNYNS